LPNIRQIKKYLTNTLICNLQYSIKSQRNHKTKKAHEFIRGLFLKINFIDLMLITPATGIGGIALATVTCLCCS
jgi:hypothetical protein